MRISPQMLTGWMIVLSPVLLNAQDVFTASAEEAPKAVPAVTRVWLHKKLPVTFSGYLIEVAVSNFPLPNEYPVFRQYGQLHYDKLERTGGYSYGIISEFSSKKAMLRYFHEIVRPNVADARLIRYRKGIREVVVE